MNEETENEAKLSIREAAAQGTPRLRRPVWVNPFDHIKIDIIDGGYGPWLHFYSPANLVLNGRDPLDILIIDCVTDAGSRDFVVYHGPDSDSEEYLAERARISETGELTR